MPQFTKSNWDWDENTGLISANDKGIAHVYYSLNGKHGTSEGRANARLIAHAPEMYGDMCEIANFLEQKSSWERDDFAQYAKILRQTLASIDGKENANNE